MLAVAQAISTRLFETFICKEEKMSRRLYVLSSALIVLALVLGACGAAQDQADEAVSEPAEEEVSEAEPETEMEEEAEAEEPEAEEEPAAEAPTDVNIVIGVSFLEEAWSTSLLQSLERVMEDPPHGLNINYDIIEELTFADASRILDQAASTGEYDIIWAHSAYYESVGELKDEYPEIAWVVAGAGNETDGGNMWYMDMTGYESAYLIGVLGGLLTESNNIGTVAEYPFPLMNTLNNAYAAGARSMNPDVTVQYTYIESWFDPPKAIESAKAQMANGADFMFSQPIGPIEACTDEGVWCAGNYVDQTDLGPDVVVTNNMIRWDPHWEIVIDAWYEYEANGVPYDAPAEAVLFGLAEGGCDISPINDMDGAISQEVIDQVMAVRQQIIDGEIEVAYNPELPE